MNRTYFAASIGHRYGDTCATFVALEPRKFDIVGSSGIGATLEELAERSAEHEREEIIAQCEPEYRHEDGEECDCGEDVVTYGAFTYDVRDLFTAAELKEHRRDLVAGKTIVLYR
jgi:hypothetical protein